MPWYPVLSKLVDSEAARAKQQQLAEAQAETARAYDWSESRYAYPELTATAGANPKTTGGVSSNANTVGQSPGQIYATAVTVLKGQLAAGLVSSAEFLRKAKEAAGAHQERETEPTADVYEFHAKWLWRNIDRMARAKASGLFAYMLFVKRQPKQVTQALFGLGEVQAQWAARWDLAFYLAEQYFKNALHISLALRREWMESYDREYAHPLHVAHLKWWLEDEEKYMLALRELKNFPDLYSYYMQHLDPERYEATKQHYQNACEKEWYKLQPRFPFWRKPRAMDFVPGT